MSRIVPAVHVELPHRTAISRSSSPPLLVLDWLTRTWFRFNILLLWIFLLFLIIAVPVPIEQKLGMLAISPIAAVLFYLSWFVFLLIVSFIPVVKIAIGFLKLIYFRMFSRLVVQPIRVAMPVWL
jgi:hypothetical protein